MRLTESNDIYDAIQTDEGGLHQPNENGLALFT